MLLLYGMGIKPPIKGRIWNILSFFKGFIGRFMLNVDTPLIKKSINALSKLLPFEVPNRKVCLNPSYWMAAMPL